ncbi:MAG: chitobiase/beta-hexosaminidase C-terminal domain-containing protein [Prevotella sp.]|nr:chitobiase/beta-hexosaminidase C-terminal domain-containing protein [Prevotella sp.]
MRIKLLALFFLLTPVGLLAQGWPAEYGGVMLQGFYWDSYSETKWEDLTNQADELSKYFSLIWVPNSGMTSGFYHNNNSTSMGYDPCFWLNHNSCWGTEEQLRTMINTFKAKGTGIIEDVVINHKNGLNDWCDFPQESWGDKELTWSCADICSGDDGGYPESLGYSICGNYDTGDDFSGYRDLDHTSSNVQENVKTYLYFLLHELGYAGFRYDMVKGYGAQYTELYNKYAEPQFSVGEYWDSKDNIYHWVDATHKTSAAFDFGLKYTINSAFGSSNWSALNDKGMAADVNYSRYSVTFVDNHDTYRNYDRLGNNVLAANAFLLAMPGTPCIFWPHWTAYKNELKKMIKARQAVGITNESKIKEQHEQGGGYVTKVEGEQGKYVLVISGYVTDYDTDGFVAVSTGTAANPNYAFYVSNNVDLGDLTATPQVSAEPGNYYPSVSTTLSASKPGATIVYTTDGSEPTASTDTKTTSSVDFTFDQTTTLKAGILYDGEVFNIEEYTYNISQSALRIYARSLSDTQMYFYTYDDNLVKINGEWDAPGNTINNTTVIDGKTWYYYDYDLKTYPTLRIIVRDEKGSRYPADGQPGVKIDDIKDKPYIILDGNSIKTYNEDEVDAFGTYYLVSEELTDGRQLETFKFQNVRRRGDGDPLDENLFSLTVNDHDIPSGGMNYYVAGIDENGKEVTYRPDRNYGLAMNPNDNKYNDQDGNTRETPAYQSFDKCKQSNSFCFTLEKGKAASYTWSLNTGSSGNVGVDADWHYDVNKWYGYPYGPYSVALNLNKSIADDEDGFYLFGNLNWNGTDWVWEAQRDEKFKFVRDVTQPDSLVYYVDVSNEGHPFENLYLILAPSTLLDTPVSDWDNNNWNKAIRMMAPADRNAIALSGGLTVPDDNGIGNKNQAFNPEIDAAVYDSYRLYINLTSATYGVIFKTSPYIVGTAVKKEFTAPDEAIALEWDDQEECYKYKGEFTNGGEMRFIVNKSYKLNWSEDSEVPGISTTDGDYYNHVAYDTKGSESEDQLSGSRITFNAPTGTYTLRFYMGEDGADSYYTLSRDIPMRNMTYISSATTGEKYGEIVESTRTIDGTVYQSATSWADNVAYTKPENVDVYVVTGIDKSGDIYKVVLKKLDTDYIPANTGVLLFSQDAPENGTDRNLLVEATGYAVPKASYAGNDNILKAVVSPLFIPGTVTGSDGSVTCRNFTFGYYRVKPYAEGTTTRGNYAYYLGFWRSSTSATDNPTNHMSSANMAYLSLTPEEYGTSELGLYDTAGNPAEAPYIHFTFDDAPEGITTIQEMPAADNGYYTLQGVRVSRPAAKGIYIHQGKKIIFK